MGYTQQTFDLYDDLASTNTFEEAGLFGNPIKDFLTQEGNYTLHFLATYGDSCTATRELIWSLHVDTGIDPLKTNVIVGNGIITIIPTDRYGNKLGPGRGGDITISGAPMTNITGPVTDNGDGSYTVPANWDDGSGNGPRVIIGQPGRPPIIVHGKESPGNSGCLNWKLLCLILLVLVLVFFILWLIK